MKKRRFQIVTRERRKKDRRKRIDPRYRNPNYPEFVDRRASEERREVEYEGKIILSEHLSERKTLLILGAVTAAILIYFFSLTYFHVCDIPDSSLRKPKEIVSPILAF